MMICEAVNLYDKDRLFAYPVLYQEEKDDNTDKLKHTLSEEERQQRAQQRAVNKERIAELKKEIEQRNSTLMPEVRTTLADLFDRDNVVFWNIRDSAERDIDVKDIWLSCKSPWIGANQLPKDFGYPEHEERDILYTSYLSSEALHLRVQ